MVKLAALHKVSYDWSQNRGLLALIYGVERMAEEFPAYPPYEQPKTPPNVPDYPDGADEDERRDLRESLSIQRRDDAVVRGFLKALAKTFKMPAKKTLPGPRARLLRLRRGVVQGMYGGDQASLPP